MQSPEPGAGRGRDGRSAEKGGTEEEGGTPRKKGALSSLYLRRQCKERRGNGKTGAMTVPKGTRGIILEVRSDCSSRRKKGWNETRIL